MNNNRRWLNVEFYPNLLFYTTRWCSSNAPEQGLGIVCDYVDCVVPPPPHLPIKQTSRIYLSVLCLCYQPRPLNKYLSEYVQARTVQLTYIGAAQFSISDQLQPNCACSFDFIQNILADAPPHWGEVSRRSLWWHDKSLPKFVKYSRSRLYAVVIWTVVGALVTLVPLICSSSAFSIRL